MTEEAILIASVCHEANRAFCLTLGDKSQLPWTDCPEWQRVSAINGVSGILRGSIRTPRDAHESWMNEKVEDGWRYGAVKDPNIKTHPCLVPYDELPEQQQRKDALFFAIVNALR